MSEIPTGICKSCGKEPSFQCREHFVRERDELRAKLKEIEERWYSSNRAIVDRDKEIEKLRAVIREAVGKLTNLHCKTKRDQSRLCMAFDALYPEALS